MGRVKWSVCARVTNGAGRAVACFSLHSPRSFVPPVWASDPAKRDWPVAVDPEAPISAPTPPIDFTSPLSPIPIKHRIKCHEVRLLAVKVLKRRYQHHMAPHASTPTLLTRTSCISAAWLDQHLLAASETHPRQHVRRRTHRLCRHTHSMR